MTDASPKAAAIALLREALKRRVRRAVARTSHTRD